MSRRAALVGVLVSCVAALALVAVVLTVVLTRGESEATPDERIEPSGTTPSSTAVSPTATPSAAPSTTPSTRPPTTPSALPHDPNAPAYDVALSRPVEDSYYPAEGDPGVDSLHYGLDLTWESESRRLTGTATVMLRATRDAPELQLDLIDALHVSSARLDGKRVSVSQHHNQLVVRAKVSKDTRYTLVVEYAGTPHQVPAPTTRSDFSTTGLKVTRDGELWTMQEPFGASTWYPVNDQPADKALYDFTLHTPRDWVGVANGQLLSRRTQGEETVTRWHLSHPASSYLTTLAVGDFVETTDESSSGVPISYWTHRGDQHAVSQLRAMPQIVDFNERYLGRYPFDTLGVLVVDSWSGMETQTMITLGNSAYTLSPEVLQHELTHQWYGDLVSPTDWRDVWMNEGMTMFLQGVYEADQQGRTIDDVMNEWALGEPRLRQENGPPGAYDKGEFGEGNIYYCPALMWNELRHRIGDQAFWAMVKKWPRVHADGNATRQQYFDWLEKQTGEELTSFFHAWIMGRTTPTRG